MSHSHTHSHHGPAPLSPLAARIVIAALTLIGVAVAVGAVLLWPSGSKVDIPLPFQNAEGGSVTTEGGHVQSSTLADCGSPSVGQVLTAPPQSAPAGNGTCVQTLVAIDTGPNAGTSTLLEFSQSPGQPNLLAGEHIRIFRQVDQQGATSYGFYDYERAAPLAILAAIFAIVIVAVARWRGLRALAGIVVAFAVLVVFMLPALRDGAPAVPVALVASSVILFAVIYLAHGVSLRTSAALLGTLTAMLLSAVLSWAAIKFTHLTGLSQDQNNEVAAYMGHVSIEGLLLAGFIIGSLGVLNDVTITQASAVFELAHLSQDHTPGSSAPASRITRREVFLRGMRVGSDHIASTVYTLVLAYAGSSLPLLLLFSVSNRSLSDVLTSEGVAIEIARSAVGGIALALAVPLTTAVAAALATPGLSAASAAPEGAADTRRSRTSGRSAPEPRVRRRR